MLAGPLNVVAGNARALNLVLGRFLGATSTVPLAILSLVQNLDALGCRLQVKETFHPHALALFLRIAKPIVNCPAASCST